MEEYNNLIQNLENYRKDITSCYEDINNLIITQNKIKELYENPSIIDPIYTIFEKLNKEILQVQKAKQLYILEKESILEIEENEMIYSFRDSKHKVSKRNETIHKSIEYHSNKMGKCYLEYLNKEKSKLKLMKEAEVSIISLFNLLQAIYPNFNKNVTFKNQYNDIISFEEKASQISDKCFEIDYKKLLKSIFSYTLNQINKEIDEKRNVIIYLLLGDNSKDKATLSDTVNVFKKAN